jgi:hypothetical protein
MIDKPVMVVFDPVSDPDGQNACRIICPETMARVIAAMPGAEIVQDDEHGLVVQAGILAGVICDLHP